MRVSCKFVFGRRCLYDTILGIVPTPPHPCPHPPTFVNWPCLPPSLRPTVHCMYIVRVQLSRTDKRSIIQCTFQWNSIIFWSIAQGTNDIGPKIHSVQLRTQKNGIIFKHLSTEETITCQHLCSAQFSRQLLASARNKQMTLAHKNIHSVRFGAQNNKWNYLQHLGTNFTWQHLCSAHCVHCVQCTVH